MKKGPGEVIFVANVCLGIYALAIDNAGRRSANHASSFCEQGLFPCEDGLKCVHQQNICDRTEDCLDGSDELRCEDEHDNRKWKQHFRKRPDVDREVETKKCIFQLYPPPCICGNRTSLYCTNAGLTEIPQGIPPEVTTLDLSGNNIKTLRLGKLGNLGSLTKLIMIQSGLREIEYGTFGCCPALQRIYLQGNDIKHLTDISFPENNYITYLDLSNNQLRHVYGNSLDNLTGLKTLLFTANRIHRIETGSFSNLKNLDHLFLNKNYLSSIRSHYFKNLTRLTDLHVTNNNINQIESEAFSDQYSLKTLSIGYNSIQELAGEIFDGLPNLTSLDLQSNPIRRIEKDVFLPLVSLESLNLKKNSFHFVPADTFKHLHKLEYIYFDEFYMCASALHVRVCKPKGDGISSHANLLESIVLRISVWIMAALSCCGNSVVLFGRLFVKGDNRVHSFYIQNLALADLLMGVYLVVIGAHDLLLRGEYLKHDSSWRDSWRCDANGILCMLSTEMSVVTLTIITLDRYVCVVYPLSLRRRGQKMALAFMAILWTSCLLLALLPVLGLPYFGKKFYRHNAVCIPLHIHKPLLKGWEYSAFIFLGLNFVIFVFMSYAYAVMFVTIRKSTMPLRSNRENQEMSMVKRFFFIVLTDFVCWVPIFIIKVMALTGTQVSDDLYAWLAIFILPVNSALNPLIYTLTTTVFKRAILANIWTKVVGKRPRELKDASSWDVANPRWSTQETETEDLTNPGERSRGIQLIVMTSHKSSRAKTFIENRESRVHN